AADAIAWHGERDGGRGCGAVRGGGQGISAIVKNIGCSENTTCDVRREEETSLNVQTVGRPPEGPLRQNSGCISRRPRRRGKRGELRAVQTYRCRQETVAPGETARRAGA